MKYKNRNRIILVFLFSLFGLQMVGLSALSHGYPNSKVTKTNEYDLDAIKPHPERPKAMPMYRFGYNYLTHDWIADSAIRLIDASSYQSEISWFFDNLVVLNDFDDEKNQMFTGDYWDTTSDMGRERWLHTRRYVYFLHGSGYPDWYKTYRRNLVIDDTYRTYPVPKEKVNYKVGWQNPLGGSTKSYEFRGDHSMWFRNIKVSINGVRTNEWYESNNRAALNAQKAAQDAITLLKFEGRPRREAAALCLGAMVHFIGDLSHPAHCVYDRDVYTIGGLQWTQPLSHKGVDTYVSQNCKTGSFVNEDPISGALIGGPDWSIVDPSDLKVTDIDDTVVQLIENGQVNGLRPIAPYIAAHHMAYLTFTGLDPLNGGDSPQPKYLGKNSANALASLIWDIDYVHQEKYKRYWGGLAQAETGMRNRVIVLLKWAIYYSACAILYVMNKVPNHNDDTKAHLLDIVLDDGNVPHDIPPNFDDIKEDYDLKLPSSVTRDGGKAIVISDVIGNLAVSLIIIIPVFALSVLPAAANVIKNKNDNLPKMAKEEEAFQKL